MKAWLVNGLPINRKLCVNFANSSPCQCAKEQSQNVKMESEKDDGQYQEEAISPGLVGV